MRRFFRASPLPIFLVAVLIAVVLVGLHSLGSVGHAAAPVKLPPGATAIMPSRPGQVPSFTEADVRAYLALFPHEKTTTGAPATISSIRFISREQASAAMNGESLSEVAPGALVCYVVIAGPFDVGPSLQLPPTTRKIGPVIVQSQHFVFDATTGNLIIEGY